MKRAHTDTSFQTCIDQALALLPTVFQPGQAAPDFSDLSIRIDEIESQQLVATFMHWIVANEAWLESEGLILHKRLVEEGRLPSAYSSLRARREELAGIPKGHEPEVKALLVKLTWNTSVGQREFSQHIAGRLNLVRWHPQKAQAILLENIRGHVEHPEHWLAAHAAWAEAEQLISSTAPATSGRARGRL